MTCVLFNLEQELAQFRWKKTMSELIGQKRQTEIVLISSEQPKSNSVIQRHIHGLTWASLLLTDFFL